LSLITNFYYFLADNIYNCLFGTFLYDSIKKAEKYSSSATISVWTYIFYNASKFTNCIFTPKNEVLRPNFGMAKLRLWEGYYLRFNTKLLNSEPSQETQLELQLEQKLQEIKNLNELIQQK